MQAVLVLLSPCCCLELFQSLLLFFNCTPCQTISVGKVQLCSSLRKEVTPLRYKGILLRTPFTLLNWITTLLGTPSGSVQYLPYLWFSFSLRGKQGNYCGANKYSYTISNETTVAVQILMYKHYLHMNIPLKKLGLFKRILSFYIKNLLTIVEFFIGKVELSS